jgi:ribose transport system substrate-binding protein
MKRVFALVMVLGLLMGLGACADLSGSAPEEIKIAIGMGSKNHPVHRIVRYGFFQGAQEYGVTGVDAGLDNGSTRELQENFTKAITEQGVHGMLLWASDDTYYQFMRDMTAEHGTVFVVPHFKHDYVETKDFISANLYADDAALGMAAADLIVEELHRRGIIEGSLGITQAGAGVAPNIAGDAFRKRIAEISNFRVCDIVFEGLELSEAAVKCVGVINSNSDIVGAFGTTGGSAQSWTKAMEETGRTDLVVVAYDYSEENLEKLENGPIHALVSAPLYEEGYDSVGIIKDVLDGKTYNDSEENWSKVYDVITLTKDSDLKPYHDLIDQATRYLGGDGT